MVALVLILSTKWLVFCVVEMTFFHNGIGGVPVDESVGASEEGKSYTGIKWIGSTLD